MKSKGGTFTFNGETYPVGAWDTRPRLLSPGDLAPGHSCGLINCSHATREGAVFHSTAMIHGMPMIRMG